MKKKILTILSILILTTACEDDHLKSLNMKNLTTKLDNKETFVLYLTDESDEGKVLKKTLEKVSGENDIETYYINIDKLNDEDLKTLENTFTFEENNIILFIKKGEEKTVLSRIDDLYIRDEKLEQTLKNQGYIK